MAPLDPDQSVGASTWTIQTLFSEGAGYLVTGALAWILSRIRIGKKLEDLGTALRSEIASMKHEITEKIDGVEVEQRRISQEMWGAHGHTGLAGHLQQMDTRIESITRQNASIDAKLEILLSREKL